MSRGRRDARTTKSGLCSSRRTRRSVLSLVRRTLYNARMAKLHAIEYLAHPDKYPPKAVCAAYGDDSFLRRQVLLAIRRAILKDDECEFSLTTFAGDNKEVQFRDVVEELTTVAMFGGQRLIAVEDADDFVSRYRPQLEEYVAHPGQSGVLVLDVKTMPATTRLYKAIDGGGLAIDCSAPATAKLTTWLKDWAKQTHKVQLAPGSADLLIEMIGPELGLLDQELAKLSLMAGADKMITPEMVQKMGGSWRAKTTWDMLDLALNGNVKEAMRQVDRLLSSGEVPISLLGQISATLRRFAAATRIIVQSEAAGKKIGIVPALEQAGMKPFVIRKSEPQLKRLGRQRGRQLYGWLLEADLDLKGDSAMPPRLILERLIIRIAAPA